MLALAPIRLYRRFIPPAFPRRCRYEPTCSAYAEQVIRELGVARGVLLAAWRLLRCNPLSDGGIDPISNRRFFPDPGVPSEEEDGDGGEARLPERGAVPGAPGGAESGVEGTRR